MVHLFPIDLPLYFIGNLHGFFPRSVVVQTFFLADFFLGAAFFLAAVFFLGATFFLGAVFFLAAVFCR